MELEEIYGVINGNQKKSDFIKAVKDISFSLGSHECFILLGVNGAGKSTTFKCLIAEEKLTDGMIQVGGNSLIDLSNRPQKIANQIGYCP